MGVSFPRRLRHDDGPALAIIYKRPDCYRLVWRQRRAVDGKSVGRSKDFRSYAEAKRWGEQLVKDLAKGRAVALTPEQGNDAVASLKLLQGFFAETGRGVSLLDCVVGHCGALRRLGNTPLSTALDGYFSTVVSVKRKDLAKAVEEWIAGGNRRRSQGQANARRFPRVTITTATFAFGSSPRMFSGQAVCELGKEHLDLLVAKRSPSSQTQTSPATGATNYARRLAQRARTSGA